MRLIWVGRRVYCWDWDDLNAWTRVGIDTTETPNLSLTLIWLRRFDPNLHRYESYDMTEMPRKISFSLFRFYTLETATRSKITTKKIGASQSYLRYDICASLGLGVSVLLVSTISLASQIDANSGSSVSIISISAVNLASHSYQSHLGHFVAVILGTPYKRSFAQSPKNAFRWNA